MSLANLDKKGDVMVHSGGANDIMPHFGGTGGISGTHDTPSLTYDLTTLAGLATAAIATTRSGVAVLAQQGTSTVVSIGNNANVWEDYGADDTRDPNAGGGLWAFNTHTPLFVSFDMSGGGGWTIDALVTLSANAIAAPDSTMTADLVTDTSAVTRQAIYRALANVSVFSVWCLNDVNNPPTGDGCLGADNTPTVFTPLGSRGTWKRVSLESNANSNFTLIPAGGTDQAKLGGVYFWGAMATGSNVRYHFPLLASAGASGICTNQVASGDRAQFVNGGYLDVEMSFRPSGDAVNYTAALAVAYLWRMDIGGLEWSLRYAYSDGTNSRVWILRANGIDILTTYYTSNIAETNTPTNPSSWREGDEITVRAYIGPDKTAIQVRNNACLFPAKFGPAGPPLATPTAVYLGSNGTTASNCINGRITRVVSYHTHEDWNLFFSVNGIILGDSTTGTDKGDGSPLDRIPVGAAIATISQARNGYRIYNIATSGDTMSGQLNKWLRCPYRLVPPSSGGPSWIAMPACGINDVNASTAAATIASVCNSSIAQIKADNPLVKFYFGQVYPADGWAGMSAGDQAIWITWAQDCAGTGPNPIVGYDFLDVTASNTMNTSGAIAAAGSNTLLGTYDRSVLFGGGGASASGDHVHENNAGRELVAGKILAQLTAWGLQPP